ncbi:hypothetical protein T4E_6550 [Trichinella pseudospiralis]|uniref:PiggyBac transposable element-derived protein domain-containing protein n=1 Tax=Trichinella pseudospiralis TaxID=6337 RepID=A0A0V0XMU2_TRIPS|nr:hypothetical protein T4E_6550 [Trichinella pseudospiralis]
MRGLMVRQLREASFFQRRVKVMVGVFCLSLVKAYNKCMDRVDLTGMLKVLFRIDYRSKAW